MRNGRVIMATAMRQFEYVNKKYLRQESCATAFFAEWVISGDDAIVTVIR